MVLVTSGCITIEKKNACLCVIPLFAENQFYFKLHESFKNRASTFTKGPNVLYTLWNINDLVFVCVELLKSFLKKSLKTLGL